MASSCTSEKARPASNLGVPQPTRGCPLQENLAPQRSARTALYLNVTLFNICVRNAKKRASGTGACQKIVLKSP
jgi:hypothetical protein